MLWIDLKPGYRLLAWPADVVEAVSGGGAYDLACAYTIPHRLTACGLICSIAPGQLITKDAPLWMRAMWWMGGHLPWLYRLFVRLLMAAPGSDAVRIERQLARSSRFFEESDRKVLQNAEARRLIAQALAEYI